MPFFALAQEREDSTLFFRGYDFMEKGSPQKAVPIFEEIIAKFPGSKVRDLTYFWLGRAYHDTNQKVKYAETLDKIKAEFPRSPLIQKLAGFSGGAAKGPAPVAPDPKPKIKVVQPLPPAPPTVLSPVIAHPPVALTPKPTKKPYVDASSPSPYYSEGFSLAVPPQADFNIEPALLEKSGVGGREVILPFLVTNQGNAEDAFTVQSSFPPEFGAAFLSGEGNKFSETSQGLSLKSGQSKQIQLKVHLPEFFISTHAYEVRVTSKSDPNQSRVSTVMLSGGSIRGEHHPDRETIRPGEEVRYFLLLENAGGQEQEVRLEYSYPPELVFRFASLPAQRVDSRTLFWNAFRLPPQRSEKIELVFQVSPHAKMGTQILNQAVIHPATGEPIPVMAPTAWVARASSARLDGSDGLLRVPAKDHFFLPFTLTNLGNAEDRFLLTGSGIASEFDFYVDRNRDGIHQMDEPTLVETPLLRPGESLPFLMGMTAPAGHDGEKVEVRVSAQSKGEDKVLALSSRSIFLTRPMLVVDTKMQPRDHLPSGTFSYRVTVTNTGSIPARNVVMMERFPSELIFVHGDPDPVEGEGDKWVWKMNELGPKQKVDYNVRFQIQKELPAGSTVQKQTEVRYQDPHGNIYP